MESEVDVDRPSGLCGLAGGYILGRASLTLGAVASALACVGAQVEGGILDFESLPYPTTAINGSGGYVYDPFGSHMGFRFSSENFFPPSVNSPFANVWFDYALTSAPYNIAGYAFGINGARALGVPQYDPFTLTSWNIEREDGGEWMYGGAQFSPVNQGADNTTLFRIVGWRDGAEVYNISTFLVYSQQLFFGAQVNDIPVDRVVMTYHKLPPPTFDLSRWFTMDDMHYQLVPAPGALVLLSLCGLLQHRHRA